MSSFIFPENYNRTVDKQAIAVRKRINRKRLRRILVTIITILSILIVMQVSWTLLVLPNMKLKNVEVISSTSFPINPDTVRAVIGIDVGDVYPDIDVKRIESQIMNNLMVEKVQAVKRFPDRLTINITERIPLAMTLFETKEGRMVPVQLDREGYIINVGKGVDYFDLPVVSGGFQMALPVPGERVRRPASSLLNRLNGIALQNPELYRLISEVKINTKGSDNFEILLYIRGHRIPVLLKESFSNARLLRAIGVMDALQDVGKDESILLIDYRSDNITYSYKAGDENDS